MAGPTPYIEPITERYWALGFEPYRWYHAEDPPPWTPLAKPLGECRVGVLSTAGTYVKGQKAYFYKDDTSTRAIPKSTPADDIRFSHVTEHYLPGPREDPNSIFPIDTLRRLEADGVIGEMAEDLFSCMGGIYSQRRVREELIPRVAAQFEAQGIDIAFLVPL
ncbi:MAG: glycine/sarcosine/betaine reductase selenoprotein B family protein [Alphaproteobacteria bacterium]|jgi:D-proline reductase (dithiol) PrdB|nr:glycine/sarcosine/betaine reductase selenoprotein B family protein [Alphaproteobacteria bacterium]